MKDSPKWSKIAGLVLHVLIGGLMIFAGSGKLFGFAPPEVFDTLKKAGLGEQVRLIGAGEIITALLLIIPPTSSLGVLLTSSFWGGAICTHMSLGDSHVFPAVLLVLSWVGAYLRNPATFSSFACCSARETKAVEERELVRT
jgi:hypothetical protein